MPSWTPGSYLIRDFAGQVEGMAARSAAGKSLPILKVAKNRWLVETRGATAVTLGYDVWGGTLSVQDNWVEQDFALLNGAGVYLYSEASRALPQALRIELPQSWPDVHVALPGPDSSGRYTARNFDELVDSPILAGRTSVYSFSAWGANFQLVNYGETELWDAQQAATDLGRLSRTQLEFWGSNPFERDYLYLNVLMGGRSGLEHDHSTVMMGDPGLMRDRDAYIKWLALASHELFHAWNVRRMRPEALQAYDYDSEVYSTQLWFAEGITSYYDNLLLFRSGAITVQEFFDLLSFEIQQYEIQPGRLVSSAEEASFDSWIKHYKPNANLVNSSSNYYRRGSVIGFVLDTAIRRESDGRFSLDDAMREMYSRYGPSAEGVGSFPPGALTELVSEMAGASVAQRLETLLSEPVDPDVDAALDWYGLVLERAPTRKAAEEAGSPPPGDFGVVWQEAASALVVESVLHGGAAANAGLLPGDELLAIDGHRVTRETQDLAFRILRPGETVTLTVSRHQRLRTVDVTVQHAVPQNYLITVKPRVRASEERRLEAWLGRELAIQQ